MALPRRWVEADFLEIALRFLRACDRRSFRPDALNWDPSWQLEAALQKPIEDADRQRLLDTVLGLEDLALRPSADLRERFYRALGRQLHIFESWTMFQLQELVHWDGGMRRLKEGITSWTIPTLRCQMLPRKISLTPLLLAKKWGLHFEKLSGKLPGSMWSHISSFVAAPSFDWFEKPSYREHHPWWDWPRHPLVFPLFATSPPNLGKCVVGISMFVGEGTADDCMHRQQLVSLTLNDVRFIQRNATQKQLWDRLLMIGGCKMQELPGPSPSRPRRSASASNASAPSGDVPAPQRLTFEQTLLCLAIFMRLKHGIPVFLLDLSGSAAGLQVLQLLSAVLTRELHVVTMENDFDPDSANGPLNSLVTLRCTQDLWLHRPTLLDALQRFLRSATTAPGLAAAPGLLPQGLTVAVLEADVALNPLELLCSLPAAVRELILPCCKT